MDEVSGTPIEGARVKLLDRHGTGNNLAAITTSDGRARILLNTSFSEGYNEWLGRRVYRHVCYMADVEVTARGFRLSKFRLEDRTDDDLRFDYDAVPPPIVVRLDRQQVP
jgi:hypothetical protein